MKNLISLLISAFKSYIIFHLVKFKHNQKNKSSLNSENNKYFKDLKKNGYVVIPNYLTNEICYKLIFDIKNAEKEYPNAVWSGHLNADKRIFGIELLGGGFKEFHEDPNLIEIGEKYFGGTLQNLQTLAGHITYVEGNEGSGEGWHRDGNNFQYKSIVYLSDVGIENGPFQLISKSNGFFQSFIDNLYLNKKVDQTRYSAEEVEKIIIKNPERLKTFTALAGTLLIVDTSIIHRGCPIKEGERFALTNYYYPKYLINQYIGHFMPRLTDDMIKIA
jgi:hypothetical protein